MPTATTTVPLAQVWLEVTSRCPLECVMCYAGSSPRGSHGALSTGDWLRVIDEIAHAGTRLVTLIGGEPLLRPDLPALITRALERGVDVEVYTSLYAVPRRLWPVLEQPGVSLATSYHSGDAAEHDAITTRRGSHARTRANITEAVRRGIPVRVGVVQLADDQAVEQAVADLEALDVPPGAITDDQVRGFGRGVSPAAAGTCGQCGHGRAAVLPDGDVAPCVFTRDSVCGSVADMTLPDIVASDRFTTAVAALDAARGSTAADCMPNGCGPVASCKPACAPSCPPLK